MKIIKLRRNLGEALVDDEDYERLNQYKWSYSKGYAYRFVCGSAIGMHHEVIGFPASGLVTDHINNNRLDNQKANLRHVTQSTNVQNSNYVGSMHGLRGVSFNRGKYVAQITHKGKSIYLGRHLTVEEAGEAYDTKARELYGEQAATNF